MHDLLDPAELEKWLTQKIGIAPHIARMTAHGATDASIAAAQDRERRRIEAAARLGVDPRYFSLPQESDQTGD
jgi:hypothetical protein